MRTAVFGLCAYLVLAAALWFGIGSISISRLRRLATEGVQAEAIVRSTSCEHHSTVSYTFEAGGELIGSKGLSPDSRPCDEIRVGDRVAVWFVPSEPTICTLREPNAALENERMSTGLGAIMMPAWILSIFFSARWMNRKRHARP